MEEAAEEDVDIRELSAVIHISIDKAVKSTQEQHGGRDDGIVADRILEILTARPRQNETTGTA